MKLVAFSCVILSGLQVSLGSPLSRVRQVTVPTEDQVLAGVFISQNIAVAVAETSTGNSIEVIDGVNSAFDSIYGMVNNQTPALDGTPWPVDRMSLLPPIDQVICMILQCDRGGILARAATNEANTTSSPTPSLPALLDPASALEEIRGWAEGSLLIGPAVDIHTLPYDIPANVATDFAGAIAGLVELWQQESGASISPPQKMAVRAVGEDVVEKRQLDPVTIGLLIHVAYLLYTLA